MIQVFEQATSLARVEKGALCSGCGGCSLIAPGRVTMRPSVDGYLRPHQTAAVTLAEDAKIKAICPGLGQSVDAGNRKDDVLWGPYKDMQTGWSRDQKLRHTASSGGALSGLLIHLLESGKIDGVVEIAADPDQPTGNITVLSRTVAEITSAAGSRYAPSAPLAELAPYLTSNERYAFVGKPCDVAALRALEDVDSRVGVRFPIMISFFCAGVPSSHGARAVLDALGADPAQVTGFRYRGMGWPGHATATLSDGSEKTMSYHDSWGKILSKHVQHRCKICADGTGKAADIVCADAWHSDEKGYPLFSEQDGVSLIVSRTAIGQNILADAVAADAIETGPFDISNLGAMQPGQYGRRRAVLARILGLRLLARPVPNYRGLHLGAAARRNSVRDNLKNFLGMLRRGIQGKIKDNWPR